MFDHYRKSKGLWPHLNNNITLHGSPPITNVWNGVWMFMCCARWNTRWFWTKVKTYIISKGWKKGAKLYQRIIVIKMDSIWIANFFNHLIFQPTIFSNQTLKLKLYLSLLYCIKRIQTLNPKPKCTIIIHVLQFKLYFKFMQRSKKYWILIQFFNC